MAKLTIKPWREIIPHIAILYTVAFVLVTCLLFPLFKSEASQPAFMEPLEEQQLQTQFPGQVVVFEVHQHRCILWRNTDGMAKGSGTMSCESRPGDSDAGFKVLGIYPKN